MTRYKSIFLKMPSLALTIMKLIMSSLVQDVTRLKPDVRNTKKLVIVIKQLMILTRDIYTYSSIGIAIS